MTGLEQAVGQQVILPTFGGHALRSILAPKGVFDGTQASQEVQREFKLEAVRLAAVDERPQAQVARQLGIRVNLLRNWRLEFEREARKPAARVGTVVDGDMERLRLENARLKSENEFLKKAAIYFARESV
jgi:transposase